jgi:TolB-like protein
MAAPSRLTFTETTEATLPEVPAGVQEQVEKMLCSPVFSRSRRLCRFLRFTVDQTLQGRQSALKEYLVGVEVFGKSESFDPRIDSIVRVEARRLRVKLEAYYRTEGSNDPIVILFPKGSYIPTILRREQVPAAKRGGAIAVRPFVSLDPDPNGSAFCAGFTTDLIGALTSRPGLRVVTFANHDRPDLLLEGNVRRNGERLRVSAQLIDVSRGEYIWSDTYDREATDIFDVQDELSQTIANDVGGQR